MFEDEWGPADVAYYARQAALLDAPEDCELLDPDVVVVVPVDVEVCARAAADDVAVTGDLLAELDGVDIDGLDASAAVDEAVGLDRVANRVAARRVRAVATAVRRQVGTERVDPVRLACAELGAALRVGPVTVSRQVTVAIELTERLTRTLAAMTCGALSYDKARLLVEQTLDLDTERALAVEAQVLDAAPARTWAQHDAAVRRAVVQVDPTAPQPRRRNAERAARVLRRYGADGLAELIVTLPVAAVDTAYTAADGWARARKATGDPRTLDTLRAEAFTRWASSYLTHGDPTRCDRSCDPTHPRPDNDTTGDDHDTARGDTTAGGDTSCGVDGNRDDEQVDPAAEPGQVPTRHGRPLRVGLVWDLASLVGIADRPGELLDSGEVISAPDMRELITGGIRIRRMLIDPATGELVDLTPESWLLDTVPGPATPPPTPHAPADVTGTGHGRPLWLGVVVDTTTWQAAQAGRLTGLLATAVTLAPAAVRDMLAAPRTDHQLDHRPDHPTPTPALAEFVALRDRHPTNPTAAPTAAAAGDTDHITPTSRGGPTTRANLHTPTRRWHLLRTHGGWQIHRHPDGTITWTSPHGRHYRTRPHDYGGP